ncbi:hypothetical protein J7E93_05050 [Streptomyces sp. ISL-36]|uniref:hypothetical protein n=1 Tax=Streptomyces sp. ISL-36 TaxID=2819182 RepID=UPI001BED3367|nr:hypothetical protein [Streptomyces sp. ISL-36]MBT2439500.1 hypothetical protein [Streptomyces sp. ISL-36]
MISMRPRHRALSAAALYVGATAVAGLVLVLTDGSPDRLAVLHLLSFPGSAVVTVLLYLTSALFGPADPPADQATEPGIALGSLVPVVGGALVNVLLIRGAVGFVRVFLRERAATRRARDH